MDSIATGPAGGLAAAAVALFAAGALTDAAADASGLAAVAAFFESTLAGACAAAEFTDGLVAGLATDDTAADFTAPGTVSGAFAAAKAAAANSRTTLFFFELSAAADELSADDEAGA